MATVSIIIFVVALIAIAASGAWMAYQIVKPGYTEFED